MKSLVSRIVDYKLIGHRSDYVTHHDNARDCGLALFSIAIQSNVKLVFLSSSSLVSPKGLISYHIRANSRLLNVTRST